LYKVLVIEINRVIRYKQARIRGPHDSHHGLCIIHKQSPLNYPRRHTLPGGVGHGKLVFGGMETRFPGGSAIRVETGERAEVPAGCVELDAAAAARAELGLPTLSAFEGCGKLSMAS
jgi:hypothetical protein